MQGRYESIREDYTHTIKEVHEQEAELQVSCVFVWRGKVGVEREEVGRSLVLSRLGIRLGEGVEV